MRGRFDRYQGDRELAILALKQIKDIATSQPPGLVNQPRGICYVGESYLAVVVPNGIKKTLGAIQETPGRRFVSHTAVLHAIGAANGCLQLRPRKTIIKARIVYPFRRGAERVNVILIKTSLIKAGTAERFQGGIQFFDPEHDSELEIPGFTSPRELEKRMGA